MKQIYNHIAVLSVFLIVFAQGTVQAQQTTPEEPLFVRPLPELIGFASLNGGVTGGEGGQEVTVTTAEELLRFAQSDDPYVINVVGSIELVKGIGTFRGGNGAYHIGSNTTIRGVGPDAKILYGGFLIYDVENVIIQNLHFDGTFRGFNPEFENLPCSALPEGEHRYNHGPCLQDGEKGPADKAIDVSNGAERVWITQNTFKRYSDEIMSIKREASYVTVSWNSFDDPITGKRGMMILIGHSDSHVPDIGRLKTTIHHNYFASRDRQPRVRFGQVHIFNNYYDNPHGVFNYGAAAQRDSEVAIEGNYYNGVGNRPWRFDINNQFGFVDQRNNILVNTVQAQTRGTFGNEVFEPNDVYDFTVDNPSDIPEIVMESMGSGNWDFTTGEQPVPGLAYSIAPAFSSTVDVRTEFEWTSAFLATGYQLQVAESAIFDADEIVVDMILNDTTAYLDQPLPGNSAFFWRVRALNDNGPSGWTQPSIFFTNNPTSIAVGSDFPQAFELGVNYPNPFNPSTSIQFALPEVAGIDLRVYDALGRQVAVLVNQESFQPGYHTVRFDAGAMNLASGVYIYRLVASPTQGGAPFVQSRTMMLVK
jgi:pectate lyase